MSRPSLAEPPSLQNRGPIGWSRAVASRRVPVVAGKKAARHLARSGNRSSYSWRVGRSPVPADRSARSLGDQRREPNRRAPPILREIRPRGRDVPRVAKLARTGRRVALAASGHLGLVGRSRWSHSWFAPPPRSAGSCAASAPQSARCSRSAWRSPRSCNLPSSTGPPA